MRHFATGLAGDKGDRPGPLARVLHQNRLAKRLATARKQRVRHLLDRVVDAFDDGDVGQHPVGLIQNPLAGHVGHGHAGQPQSGDQNDHAQAWDLLHIVQKRVQALRQHCLRGRNHPGEDAVKRANDVFEHPDGDGQRQPDKQSGEDVFFHKETVWVGDQWQAQDEPQGEAPLSPPPDEVLDSAGAAAAVEVAAAAVAGALVPPAPPRKSVTYQPEPLS